MRPRAFLVIAALLSVLEVITGLTARGAPPQTASATGTLRGRVDIVRERTTRTRRPGVADLGAPRPDPGRPPRPAVVYLQLPGGRELPATAAVRTSAADARMDQRNETFWPGVLAVTAGSSVDFPNSDTTYHNVFSLSKARRFDLGRYGAGKSRSVTFDRPGIVRVFCDIHSHMNAFVLVFNHPYHATTDGEGRYRIEDVPPGTYEVAAWHEGSVRDTRTITIPPTGPPVELDLLVR